MGRPKEVKLRSQKAVSCCGWRRCRSSQNWNLASSWFCCSSCSSSGGGSVGGDSTVVAGSGHLRGQSWMLQIFYSNSLEVGTRSGLKDRCIKKPHYYRCQTSRCLSTGRIQGGNVANPTSTTRISNESKYYEFCKYGCGARTVQSRVQG